MKKDEASTSKPLHIGPSFIARILIRTSLRFMLGKKRRDRVLGTLFVSRENEVRDLIFFIAQKLHYHGLLKTLPHEQNVQKALCRLKGELFVDIGANIGFYCFILNKNFKRIMAVEPHPNNVQEIKKNMNSFRIKNVECVQKAISNKNGLLPLFISDGDAGHALGEWTRENEHIIVETITLQTLVQDFETVDLVKVDVEGAEWRVLEGSLPIVKKIRCWVIELHNLERKSELENSLSSLNYDSIWLDYNHIFAWRR